MSTVLATRYTDENNGKTESFDLMFRWNSDDYHGAEWPTLVRVTHGNRIFKLEDFADSVEFFEAVEDYVCPILIDLLDGNEMDALGNVYGLPGSGIFEPCGRQRLEDWSATRRAARARC